MNHLLLENKVDATSTDFNNVVNPDGTKIKLIFTILETNIKMQIYFERNKENNNILSAYMKFYYCNEEVHYSQLDPQQFIMLKDAYSLYIDKYIRQQPLCFIKSLKNFIRTIIKLYKIRISRIKEIFMQYKDLRAIDIFTFYYSNTRDSAKIIARTSIQLDADIITIIPENMKEEDQLGGLLSLHRSNIYLGNYLFLTPLTRIFKAIRTIRYFLSLLPVPLWLIITFFSKPLMMDNMIFNYILSIIGSTLIPQSISKIISIIVRKKIKQHLSI